MTRLGLLGFALFLVWAVAFVFATAGAPPACAGGICPSQSCLNDASCGGICECRFPGPGPSGVCVRK